jgi:hypothetical protein
MFDPLYFLERELQHLLDFLLSFHMPLGIIFTLKILGIYLILEVSLWILAWISVYWASEEKQ